MAPAKVGACLWLLCLQFFIAEQIVAAWAGMRAQWNAWPRIRGL